MKSFNKHPVLGSLLTMAFGVLIICGMFAYYHFHLGIKPCKGLPSDADNCADADLGGAVFLMIGGPIILIGIILFLDSLFSARRKRTK